MTVILCMRALVASMTSEGVSLMAAGSARAGATVLRSYFTYTNMGIVSPSSHEHLSRLLQPVRTTDASSTRAIRPSSTMPTSATPCTVQAP